ncbi:MAG: MFS transporter [Alphaproteobacteria bacterium]|nr:MFS transporter [Alphaproteobacteria bacterium]MCB9929856.1 MFS transporter [Alphaproteobacteria bacterium]
MSTNRLVFLMCAFLGLNLLGMHATATLLPFFIEQWSLSGTEAGWLNGIMGLTSTLAIPFLTITDRIDARRVMLAGAIANVVGYGGFALFADGFASALVFRGIQGLGFAGTYMVGVKAIGDRVPAADRPRATSRYVSSFPICASSSVVIAAELAKAFGWQASYALPAIASSVAFLLALFLLRPAAPEAGPKRSLFDLGPIVRNRPVLGFGFAAFMHTVELLGVRAWSVAFYVFAVTLHGRLELLWLIPAVTTLLILMGSPTSFAGGEAGVRAGYARVTALVMIVSGLFACLVGFAAAWPFWLLLLLILGHNLFVLADSGVVNGGAMAVAEAGSRGTLVMFMALANAAGGLVGPVLFGTVLDLTGGPESVAGWGWAFASLGFAVITGGAMVWLLARGADRRA